MSMAVENRQQTQLAGLPFDAMRYQPPQFTNPWVAGTSGQSPNVLYSGALAPTTASLDSSAQQQQSLRPPPLNLQYAGATSSAAPLGTGSILQQGLLEQPDLLGVSQDILNTSRSYGSQYSGSPSPATYAPTTSAAYPMDYGNRTATYGFSDPARRSSHPSVNSMSMLGLPDSPRRGDSSIDFEYRLSDPAQRNGFSEALEASRGMVSLSNSDITPRNIYGGAGDRSSVSSYGFPSTHSSHSSISSASYGGPYSYTASVGDSSVTDYSSASESVDLNSRTLPRPTSLVGTAIPPAPQSMMGQFSSKVASSSQKKHKCKICDKRFTRPSSLQTHMYSHTGEKPFACEVEGCGRHFSVVSNLRRHRKVHKNEGDHDDHPSPDD